MCFWRRTSQLGAPAEPERRRGARKWRAGRPVESPTAVGPRPELAPHPRERPYKFPDNYPGLKSLNLFLTDPHPRSRSKYIALIRPFPHARTEVPIGLDGLYRKGSPMALQSQPRPKPGRKEHGRTADFVITARSVIREQRPIVPGGGSF